AGGPARDLRVGRAVGAVPGAEIVQIAFADRRAAECQRRLERVVRTRRAAAHARLGDVADARRRAARGPRVAGRMLTRIADPVAGIGCADVAVVRARRPARLLRIGRTVRAGARTGLGEVAFARRRATRGARVARIVDAQRIPRRPVTQVRRADVAVVRARGPRRLHGVARTGGAVARTRLLEVALVRRRTADERRRLERVVGTRAAAARARLGHVAATARGGAARGPRIARVVDAERTADGAVAQVRRADVAVVAARRARRLDGVGGTG